MKFLDKCLDAILEKNPDLLNVQIVLPGKRPVVFLRDLLSKKKYNGFLPEFKTIEELIKAQSEAQEISGVALWLLAFEVYGRLFPQESLSDFLKWFPTLLKDWDDILKFADAEAAVLQYMVDEERIKNWGENLGEDDNLRKRNLTFWRKMKAFLPELKQILQKRNLATSGMMSENVRNKTERFAASTSQKFYFLGFNAFTPTEEKMIKNLLQHGKAEVFFMADEYYMKDERQEAGKFLRQHQHWKEFNPNREFKWIYEDFNQAKKITTYEVSGNVSQTKVLPKILEKFSNFDETAVVLLDENLLPATLDALGNVSALNITMGYPLKNLSFSAAVRKVFHLQKQLEKNVSVYYYSDVWSILEEMPKNEADTTVVDQFLQQILQRNIIYIPRKFLEESLQNLTYFALFLPQKPKDLLSVFVEIIGHIKSSETDDVLFETLSHFEKIFTIIQNQLQPYNFAVNAETLEVLISQHINSESIDFEGEPLQGLQVMGLLETRLLNFKNVILLSANEGKLPLGNSQNTFLPFDVRQNFKLNTFVENDSIYAYHFYRLLQDCEQAHLLFNALSSGNNSGEKSRFITQIEIESPHKIEKVVIENPAKPVEDPIVEIQKSETVLSLLKLWTNKISASHLISYLYNPVDFYLSQVLSAKKEDEIEEELSIRNYGNLVHYGLQYLYEIVKGKILSINDLGYLIQKKDEALNHAISLLNHDTVYYEKGINFIHKNLALRTIHDILNEDLRLLKNGHKLEIINLEERFENVPFAMENGEVKFKGFIDRIDRLDGVLRIIDYKTGKANNLHIKEPGKNKVEEDLKYLFLDEKYKQAIQLSIYAHVILQNPEYHDNFVQCGIWSFAEVKKGVQNLQIFGDDQVTGQQLFWPREALKTLIEEILNPEIPFTEKTHQQWVQ